MFIGLKQCGPQVVCPEALKLSPSFTDIIGSQAVLLELFTGSRITLYPSDFVLDIEKEN